MARIDDLIAEIGDERVWRAVAAEVKKLRVEKKFGLVFWKPLSRIELSVQRESWRKHVQIWDEWRGSAFEITCVLELKNFYRKLIEKIES